MMKKEKESPSARTKADHVYLAKPWRHRVACQVLNLSPDQWEAGVETPCDVTCVPPLPLVRGSPGRRGLVAAHRDLGGAGHLAKTCSRWSARRGKSRAFAVPRTRGIFLLWRLGNKCIRRRWLVVHIPGFDCQGSLADCFIEIETSAARTGQKN